MFTFMIVLSSISALFSFVQLCGALEHISSGNESAALSALIGLGASIISICIFSILNSMQEKIENLEKRLEEPDANKKDSTANAQNIGTTKTE